MLLEVSKVCPTGCQILTIVIDITEILLDDDALGCQLAMELRVKGCVERHELIRHNTTTTIDSAMLTKRLILQGVNKVYAVCIGQLATLQTIHHIHRIILILTFLIWFLDAAT